MGDEKQKVCTLAPEHCPHVAEAADTAVKKVFAILGVDVDVPKEVEQFRENLRRRSTAALSLTRYLTLVTSYVLWFSYGFLKGTSVGWDGAWTICLSTGLGLVASSAILIQFYLYRERNPLRHSPFITLPDHKTAQRA